MKLYIFYKCWLCLSFITIHNLTYLTECENLQNLDSPLRFLFEDFHPCSCYNNINYCTWYFYKCLFGSSVATSWLTCSEFYFQLTKKSKREVQEMDFGLGLWQITQTERQIGRTQDSLRLHVVIDIAKTIFVMIKCTYSPRALVPMHFTIFIPGLLIIIFL